MHKKVRNTQRYNFVAAGFAFILWSLWSFYINSSAADFHTGLISGLVQGLCSFLITLLMSYLIEWQFNLYSAALVKLFLPPLLTVVITGSILVLVHHLIHTPDILSTVAPALTVALLFAGLTNLKLYRQLSKPEH